MRLYLEIYVVQEDTHITYMTYIRYSINSTSILYIIYIIQTRTNTSENEWYSV